jgi:hypothetical protein
MILIRKEKPDHIETVRKTNLLAFKLETESGIVDKLGAFCTEFLLKEAM